MKKTKTTFAPACLAHLLGSCGLPAWLRRLLMAMVLSGLTVSAHADIRQLDDFSTGSLPGFMFNAYFYENSVFGTGSFESIASGALGGVRELHYSLGTPAKAYNSMFLEIWDDGRVLGFSGAFRINSFTLIYDGVPGPGAGLNADLSQALTIVVDDLLVDHWNFAGATRMTLSLTDGFGLTRSKTLTVPNTTPAFTPVDFVFDLRASAFFGLNFSDIDRIAFSYTGDHSQDGMLSGLLIALPDGLLSNQDNTVPTPGTLALLLAGLATLARRGAWERRDMMRTAYQDAP